MEFLSPSRRSALVDAAVLAGLAAIAAGMILWICAFKIVDSDFWWHVKAGELMWKSGALLRVEPFSYVLAEKPYGALHEWLAQIVFYLIFHSGGVTASILLRGVLAAAGALLLVGIDKRSAWMSLPILVVIVYLHRATLMVRPQLFTIFFVCASLSLACWQLRLREERLLTTRKRLAYASAVLLIQLLWVNLHGASAIFGVCIQCALFLHSCAEWYRSSPAQRRDSVRECTFRAGLLGVVIVALLGSPNGFKTFVDMYAHRFDRTIPLVREWMPLRMSDYVTDVLPFGLLGAAAALARRRAPAFSFFLLLVFGALSFQSYRHCLVFVLVSTGVFIFELSTLRSWTQMQQRIPRFSLVSGIVSVVLMGMLLVLMYQRDIRTVLRTNTSGFGVQMPVQGAVDFAMRENISGTLFNTYNQGGYILYRCAPGCKVFADGRNIEYGYPFVQKLLDAGTNVVRWKELNAQYNFTYAIVEYKSVPTYGNILPYVDFLENDPAWSLVYIDDEATVYVRNLPEYQKLISSFAYRILSPQALEYTDTLASLGPDEWAVAETELQRVIGESPKTAKARIILANRYFATRRLAEAKMIATQARNAQPYRPEVYELLGRIAAEQHDWAEAGGYLERAVELIDDPRSVINYDYLAMIFSKAGEYDKAKKYHDMAVAAGQASPVIDE